MAMIAAAIVFALGFIFDLLGEPAKAVAFPWLFLGLFLVALHFCGVGTTPFWRRNS